MGWWLGTLAAASLLTGAAPSHAGIDADGQAAAVVDTAAPAVPVEFPATLAGQIDAALAQPFLATAQLGVVAFDLESGHVLYQRGAELALNPASNMKLVTTATALGVLGPAHRFSTRLYHDKDALQGSTIEGDVYLRGSGDPALVTEDLLRMAADLRARGIRRITGGIVIDATRFDRDELPPGFDQKEELAAYRAPSGAASVNFNTFELRVRPGQSADASPFAALDPPVPHLELVNDAKTGPGHLDRLSVALEVEKKKTRITLRGTIGVDAGSKSYRYPVDAPSIYAGEVLAYALRNNGVKLGQGRIRRAAVPGDAALLAVHHSEPLSVLIRAVNKHSNNFMAEQILKGLASAGAPATFADALTRVREHLGELGIDTKGLHLGNGSGLYDTNRISAGQLVALLSAVYRDFRVSSDYLASLAIMGVDGTTRSRLETSDRRGFVRAKTGTLDGVYCLSGYAGAPGRAPIAFSILFNGLRKADAGNARATHNRIAELLARHAAGVPLVVEAPSVPTTPPAVDTAGEPTTEGP
ncbi:MAG: D-alanyl-D-alanine carboxypeptidase/D-alanyl-D-alanine-endopeptidase [Deltaproteobacteria bacterium]|nr:D-alanyl-D-alanine carboxypeptidase/D-alanyl-D-alanine-endopeptidase [Deltaproteobacteria bacterium]MBK8717712.1 D-alanyl-D-alanine carboxypeptidase/D-alanyl-D-alanine-endopeptidase [Deltaproteobacteria bacterium]MBP7288761.1 D-alanyl-D-alanine carboxypeptidase/D-alanyl-D-alanine-endopeptidase [Nannocystaceae bacterium]